MYSKYIPNKYNLLCTQNVFLIKIKYSYFAHKVYTLLSYLLNKVFSFRPQSI